MTLNNRRNEIVDEIQKWSELVPDPDQPLIGVGAHEALTPREIADHVRKGTEIGKSFVDQWLEISVEEDSRPAGSQCTVDLSSTAD